MISKYNGKGNEFGPLQVSIETGGDYVNCYMSYLTNGLTFIAEDFTNCVNDLNYFSCEG